jgi:sacsin
MHTNSEINPKGKGKPDYPHLDGTAIRLPLRSRPSSLSTKCAKPEDVLNLFNEFTGHDLECVLLFLKNVREIAIYEVTSDGKSREICWVAIRNRGPGAGDDDTNSEGAMSKAGENYSTWKTVIETRFSTSTISGPRIAKTETTWRLLDCPFTDKSSARILGLLSEEHNPKEEMARRKLHQRVQVAAPLSIVTSTTSSNPSVPVPPSTPSPESSGDSPMSPVANSAISASYGISDWKLGRLFSGLPLPRLNNRSWPIHVDARFALPPSRQFIRSSLEGG